MGCLNRIGCGVLLIATGAAGYAYRDAWIPRVKRIVAAEAPPTTAAWAPITTTAGARAKARVATMQKRGGPSEVSMTASEFAAYVLGNALGDVARRDTATQAVVEKGMLYIRTSIRLADIGGRDALGPLGRLLNDEEPLLVGGTLTMVRPGLAQYRLKEVALRDIEVPRPVVGSLVKRWSPAKGTDSLATDGLPVELPSNVVDLRLVDGKVTLYKKAP